MSSLQNQLEYNFTKNNAHIGQSLENNMKKVFSPLLALASVLTCTNVTAADIIHNDFEDGTTQGWGKGSAATNPVTIETEEGGNKYIKFISNGGTPDTEDTDIKITLHNSSGGWRGNYNAKGATTISARFKNMGTESIEMHAAFGNTMADLRTRYVVITGVVIPPDGEWHDASFSLDDVQMVPLGGHGKSNATFSAQETLGNVKTVRFTQGTLGVVTGQGHAGEDAPFTGWNSGAAINADIGIDDIKLMN